MHDECSRFIIKISEVIYLKQVDFLEDPPDVVINNDIQFHKANLSKSVMCMTLIGLSFVLLTTLTNPL